MLAGNAKKNEGENQRNSSGKDPITNVIFLENNDIMFPLALLYEKWNVKCWYCRCMFRTLQTSMFPANISPSDQRCFNVVDQRLNNVDPTMKMKQNSTSDFQRCTTLIQCRFPTLKQRWNNIDTTLSRRCFNMASTIVKAISKPLELVTSTD